MVGLVRIELTTSALSVLRSNRLSYSPGVEGRAYPLHLVGCQAQRGSGLGIIAPMSDDTVVLHDGRRGTLAEAVDAGIDESGTAPGDRRFRPDVQGLRAVAVALVVAFHAGVPGLRGGFVGVDVFFAISGFVITGLLLRERQSGSTSLAAFWARRARRILPMATVVLLVTIAASYVWLGPFVGRQVARDGTWTALLAANVHAIVTSTSYFASTGPVSPLLHYWSLAVEEQFYLAFPFIFLGAVVLRRSTLRRRLGAVLVVVIGASLLLSVLQTQADPLVAYFSPFTRGWELAAGGFVAVASTRLASMPRSSAMVVSWLGLAGIVAASVLYGPSTPYPGWAALLPVVGACLVIAGGAAAPPKGAELLLGTKLGQTGGDLSYSLYLWHFPVLVIAAEAMTTPLSGWARGGLVAVAVLASIASRRWIEDPVRHARWLVDSNRRSLALGGGLIALSVAVCLCLVATTGHVAPASSAGIPGSTSLPLLRAQVATGVHAQAVPTAVTPPLGPPPASLSGPTVPDRCWVDNARQTSIAPCSFGDLTSSRTVLLLGDSTAAMWSGAFVELAQHNHERLVLVAKTGCAPWLTKDLIFGGGRNPWCSAWHRFEVAEAQRLHPSAIVVTGFVGVPAQPSQVRAGITRLLVALKSITPDVSLLSNLPAVPPNGQDPAACVLVHPSDLSGCNLSVEAFMAAYGGFRADLRAGATTSGAHYVDLDPLMCTATWCPVLVAHHLVYRDLFHLNTAYVSYVARPLGTLLGSEVFSPPRA